MAGNRLPLNLGPRVVVTGARVPLNLGVDWDSGSVDPPAEPPLRGLWSSRVLPWQRRAEGVDAATGIRWSRSGRADQSGGLPWGMAASSAKDIGSAWSRLAPVGTATAAAWARAGARSAGVSAPWRGLPRHQRGLQGTWNAAREQRGTSTGGAWRSGAAARMSLSGGWWARLTVREQALASSWRGRGAPHWLHRRMPWGPPRLAPWVVLPPPSPPEPPAPPSPFPPGNRVGLNLGCLPVDRRGIAPLNLGVTACYAVRLRRRVYIVINTLQVVRLPDRLPIEVESVSISGGLGATCWDVEMTLIRAADLAALQPSIDGPAEIEVTLNGYVWTFLVEDHSRTRQWADGQGVVFSASLRGRSRTALLAAPYAPLRSAVSTLVRQARQLVDAELTFTGFTAQYDAVDWLVPAGAWFYDGLAPLDAIAKVATASGAVVLSDPAEKTVRVLPRYPVSPWDWTTTTPAAVIPDDVVLSEGLSVRSAPLYDAVVVTGELEGKGVLVRAVRDGEAGTLYAPQASDPLINTVPVATERARNILSDRGEQAAIDIVLPLFPAGMVGVPGRVLPMELVARQQAAGDWNGQVTFARFDATRSNGALDIDQTLTIERHYTDAH